MSINRQCDVCRSASLTVKRYGLTRQTARAGNQRNTTWGMGGIDLCDPCWERIGKPKTKPQRAKPHRLVRIIRSDSITERIEPISGDAA